MIEKLLSKSVRLACLGGVAVGVGLVSQGAFAQETAQRVEITGSSIKRVDSETALPVSVVTRADIEKSGVTSTEELLYQINTVSSAGGQVAAN